MRDDQYLAILGRWLPQVPPSCTLVEAFRRMSEAGIGALVVVDGDRQQLVFGESLRQAFFELHPGPGAGEVGDMPLAVVMSRLRRPVGASRMIAALYRELSSGALLRARRGRNAMNLFAGRGRAPTTSPFTRRLFAAVQPPKFLCSEGHPNPAPGDCWCGRPTRRS